ncbi:MAG: MFS transporter [Micropruina sp.]|nr:MFS transporter [Micropruina sp.]
MKTGLLRDGLRLPTNVWVLSISGFLVAVGFGVMLPVLPSYAKSFDANNFQVGVIVSAFAAVRLAMSPFAGRLATKLGTNRTIGFGIYFVGLSSLVMAYAGSYPELLFWRAIGGLGSAAFSVAALMALMAGVAQNQRGQAAGIYQGGFLLGGMAGPAIGGALSTISMRAPFLFYAAMLVIAGTLALVLLKNPGVAAADEGTPEAPAPETVTLAMALKDRRYQASLLSSLAQGWQSFGVRSALVPILIVEYLHAGTAFTGVAFAVAAVVQTLVLVPTGRLVDRWGRRPMMILGATLTGLATLATPFAPDPWTLVAILCVYGVGAASLSTAPTAAVGDVVHGAGGTPIAVYSMMADVGAMAGPLVAGLLTDTLTIQAAFVAGAALLGASALFSATMPRETRVEAAR